MYNHYTPLCSNKSTILQSKIKYSIKKNKIKKNKVLHQKRTIAL